MAKNARTNKSKKEIIFDMNTANETERVRGIVKEKIFPFINELKETIGFSKIFFQVSAVTVESAFSNLSKDMKVGELIEKIRTEVFKADTEENKNYIKFLELMKDETVSTFVSLMQATPRQIEMYFTQISDKKDISEVDVDKILG